MKHERTITQKIVEAALIMKQINGEMIQTVPDNVDLKYVYCANFTKSVINGVTPEMFCCELIRGDGGELSNASGSAPKFNSIVSSASMAVSTFAPWKNRLSELYIDLGSQQLTGFKKLEFEHIARTAIPRAKKHPNIDVWLENDDTILAIECKFCEFLNNNSYKELKKSYYDMIEREGYSGKWIDAIHKVINSRGQGIYKYFDVVQIIKHYFGVINTDKSEKHLLYLYWHPENQNWNKIHPYDVLESELDEFSKIVLGAGDVQFHYMSFNDLWNQWESKHKEHVLQLREKYSVTLNQSY